MPSKEHDALVEQVGQLVYKAQCHRTSPNHAASEILSTIHAALQEPNRPMSEIGQPYVRVGYDAWDVWRAMLNASPLGEQGE